MLSTDLQLQFQNFNCKMQNTQRQRGHSQGAQRSISTVPRILDSCFGHSGLEIRLDDTTFLAEIKELIKAVAEEVGEGCGFVVGSPRQEPTGRARTASHLFLRSFFGRRF